MQKTLMTIFLAMLMPTACVTFIPDAEAAPFEARLSADGPKKERARSRSANSVERRKTVTGRNGRTAERTSRATVDRENRTLTRQQTATGPNGRTATRDSVTTRTENGYQRSAVATGPNGQTVTTEANGSYDPESGWQRNRTRTGPNGNTATDNATITRDGENGVSRTRVTTSPDGRTRTRTDNAQVDRDAGTYSRDSSITRPNGDTVTADIDVARTESGRIRTATRTDANGNTETVTKEIERESPDDE
ncbi:MAG: hypothetical protein AAAFM81_06580 [Pseudomonadota bacterium]